MSHPIIEGAIKLLKIVTPGAYWIKCDECEGSCRTPASIKHKPHSNEYYYPQQGDKVFVQDKDRFFYRGTVCGRRLPPNSRCWVFVIQLTDTFQVKDFEHQDIYPTYGESSASCESAHLVSLYHTLPQLPPTGYGKGMDSVERKAFENVVANWDQSAASLAHLIRANVKFSFEQSRVINGSIYGAFSASTPLQTKSLKRCCDLSDYLHFEKLAVKMTFQFEAVVEALMSNPLVDCTKLMATFDPFRTSTIKPKPAPSREEPRNPIEFDLTGFKVYSDDVTLHQSLIFQDCYVNIIYTGAVLKQDTVVRYQGPDGKVVLGTVQNFNVKFAAQLDNSDHAEGCLLNGRETTRFTKDDSDGMLEKFPPYYNSGKSRTSTEPGKSLLSYDFSETLRNFEAAGGFFKELLVPYPFSPAVEKLMVQQFDLMGVESLHEWQKLCLPTLSCRKNSVFLGSKSNGKLTMATISALSWMSYVNPPKYDSTHPQLIIFISDFNRAGKAVNLCKQLTDFRVILSTSAFLTEKQKEEAMDGCDVLITTPSNWAKLVDESVFNYSRLNHVIFDEFYRLHERYLEDITNIFEALELSSSRRVQAVIVSDRWGAGISERKIREQFFTFPTVCSIDPLLACLYCNLTTSAVLVKHEDWIRHLGDILSNCSAKRLLLCKDEMEGNSIVEKMSHIDHVLFAHENLRKNAANKMVREWDQSSKLLICTDECFEHLGFLKDVGVMISWMTSSRATLCSRFMAFRQAFVSKKSLSWASAYLFCDCENFEELLLINNISNIRCVNGELHEHLSRASIRAEYGKLTHICPSVFMFGKCKDVPLCPLRHVFLPVDGAEVPDSRLFLNVNILRVHSAFRYSVRVNEIVCNYALDASVQTSTLMSKLKEIESGLAKFCRKRCSPGAIKIGQIVGACIVTSEGDLLRRVTVNYTPGDSSSDLYSLSIMDFEEPDVHLPHSQLFFLPDEVAKHPKDVIDLYITGLVPADFRSDWQHDTFEYLTNLMNQLNESTYLAGNVEMVTGRSVLVDTLNCFRENEPPQKITVSVISSDFSSLKDLILTSGFCIKNVAHLPSLSKSLVKTQFSPSCRSIYFLNPVGKYGFRSNLPDHSVPAVVSSYVDPGLIYVQLTEESKKLRYFENSLSVALERSKRKLQLVALDELCVAQNNGIWKRALIVDILADVNEPLGSVHVLFVDHGDSLVVQPHELYCLPSSDYVFVPFFALQCELFGIKPFHDDLWHVKATEEFGSYVRNSNEVQENFFIDFCDTKNSDDFLYYPSRYLVVLWHPNDPHYSINYELARRGFASFDQETKHVLTKPLTNGYIRK